MKLHGKTIGKGKVKPVSAGRHGEIRLKLSRSAARKLRHGHHKLALTIVAADGGSTPIDFKRTIHL